MFDDSYLDKIYRFSAPSLLDTAPYLTLCISDDDRIFIQMCTDEERPAWHLFDGTEKQAIDLVNSIMSQKNF